MRKPCCDKQETNKGAWSKQEDQKLIDYIKTHGEGCWRSLPKAAGLHRCGKSCRLRWINYLRPNLKRGNFGEDEEDLILKLHALLGNRWSLIAGRLPGRTDNEVKNYWNSHIKRKLVNMGIDPNNHKLSTKIPEKNQNRCVSGTSTSSFDQSMDTEHNVLINKPTTNKLNHDDDDKCLSGTKSWIKDEKCGSLINLNLELTIAIHSCPPNSTPMMIMDKNDTHMNEWSISREVDQRDTLILFT